MPLKQFWYADTRLLLAYKKTYLSDISYKAWLQGVHSFEAHSLSLANAFAKKGVAAKPYPEWKDPVEKLRKLHTKKENYEVAHHRQQMWFYDMLQS